MRHVHRRMAEKVPIGFQPIDESLAGGIRFIHADQQFEEVAFRRDKVPPLVYKFNRKGRLVKKWDGLGDTAGRFKNTLIEIAVDTHDDVFVVDGSETLNLPIGEQTTLKLTRLPNKPYDLTVEVWLAPTLGYLPSRIRLTQSNGDFIDQQLRSSETP